MEKFNKKHPIMFSFLLSIFASIIYALFIDPLIKTCQNSNFLKIIISSTSSSKISFMFQVNAITILFILGIIIFLTIKITHTITYSKTKKEIKNKLPDDVFCEKCINVEKLVHKNTDLQKQYNELEAEYRSELPYKKLTDCLSVFFKKTDILESLQLFSTIRLPSAENISTMSEINIPLHFIGGNAKDFSNTNALFSINYTFNKSIYYDLKKLFDLRNKYYLTKGTHRDPDTEKEIQKNAIDLFNRIKNDLDSINDNRNIQDTHYACYRMLEILANLVIGDTSIINCDQLLQSKEIETQLKYGQRTSMLGAIFTENLYCFYNENSITKKDRMYFSVPIEYKGDCFLILGICNKNNLKITATCDYVKCCEQIFEDMEKSLSELGGVNCGES